MTAPKLTDKERLARQFGAHKGRDVFGATPPKHEDARRSPPAPNFGANYGPSSSYTPASDNHDTK